MATDTLAHELFRLTGAQSAIRFFSRKGLRILLYHRFEIAQRTALERQCAHLRKHYNPVSLTQVARWLRRGQPLPANAVAVTVDDGYGDFFSVAYPVFSGFKIPVTIFLTTAYLDGACWLWVDEVSYALTLTNVQSFEIQLAPGESLRFRLDTPESRKKTALTIKQAAKRLPNRERLALIRELLAVLKVQLPERLPREYEPLTWDEVRTMTSGGIEFGAHTKTHPILSRLETKDDLRAEIEGSKLRIEEELRASVTHFSYPNGMPQDLRPETLDVVKKAGFETAVTAQAGLNFTGCDPFLLRRIPVEPDHNELLFQRVTAGFRLARS